MRLTMADRAAAYIQRFPAPAAAWPRVSTEGGHHRKGADPAEWPEDLRVQQFPRVQVPA